jgi:hypothetical protein
MSSVAAVPVRKPGSAVPMHGVRLGEVGWADMHWLASIKRERLERPLYVVTTGMDQVDDWLVELLALADLCRPHPTAPHSPGGPITYPRWGDEYWVGGLDQETGGQTKRYVVVSHDFHNAVPARPVIVRTTSQPKRNALEFPAIEDGSCHACCGDVRSHPSEDFDLRRRPTPDALSIDDMRRVAYGLASVLDLENAVVRAGGTFEA